MPSAILHRESVRGVAQEREPPAAVAAATTLDGLLCQQRRECVRGICAIGTHQSTSRWRSHTLRCSDGSVWAGRILGRWEELQQHPSGLLHHWSADDRCRWRPVRLRPWLSAVSQSAQRLRSCTHRFSGATTQIHRLIFETYFTYSSQSFWVEKT